MIRTVLISGTGTEIGKTHFTEALARAAAAQGKMVAAWKPIESGVRGASAAGGIPPGSDFERLRAASSFHVQHLLEPVYRFAAPVSPHLAARRERASISVDRVLERHGALTDALPDDALLLLELPGGLFSPLAPDILNADLVARLGAPLWLVAPDRLGVLHDALAIARSQHPAATALAGVVLSTPAVADASTGSNAEELALFLQVPVLRLPRAPCNEIAQSGQLLDLLRLFFGQ